MSQNSPFEELINKGSDLLSTGDYFAAIDAFKKALQIQDTLLVRNHLALAYYYAEQPLQALEILKKVLVVDDSQPFYNPFSFSLAAIILSALGKAEEAAHFLDLAVDGYTEGSRLLAEAGLPFDTVGAYLTMMMKAAGEIGQHRRLLELFQTWKKEYLSWECVYYAGAAAFNLGAFHLAADYWALIGHAVPICQQMQKIALMLEQEALPPFTLEYQVVSNRELQEQMENALADQNCQDDFIGKGYARMLLLGHLFKNNDIDAESAFTVLNALVGWGGDWGLELGQRLLSLPGITATLQEAARRCLVECGELPAGDAFEPEAGLDEDVESNGLEVIQVDYSPEQEALFEHALGLMHQGFADEALSLWENMLYEERKLHPPALFHMIDIYAEMRRFDDAGSILDLLEQISYAEQGIFAQEICFKRALLAYYEGDPDRAWKYLDKLDIDSLTEEEHAGLLEFREILREAGADSLESSPALHFSDNQLVNYREMKRRQVEDKNLTIRASLLRGLKNMPVQWVDAICLNLGIIGQARRRDRERQIIAWLKDRQLLNKLVLTLDNEQHALLKFVAAKGGWAAIAEMAPHFGALEGESYDWLNDGTTTPLGTLWSLALLMVGRVEIDGRSVKAAIIPAEIREPLEGMLK